MKVIIFTEFLTSIGGAEKVVADLATIFPKAPIRTILYQPHSNSLLDKNRIQESNFGQKLPQYFKEKGRRFLLPILPIIIEQESFEDYDLIISISHSFAKGIISPQNSKHICYCLSPTRYLWDWGHNYIQEQKRNLLLSLPAKWISHKLRIWDYSAAKRPDFFIASSKTVQQRIKRFYNRNSTVIYPGVDIENFKYLTNTNIKNHEKYFLIVGQQSAYKNIDTAIKAFNQLKDPLYIVGNGDQNHYLKRIAKQNIKFFDRLDQAKLNELFRNCFAYITPGTEDFGLAAIEAMACGKPVIAYQKGGCTETIQEGISGEFFTEYDNPLSIIKAVKKLKKSSYDSEKIKKIADQFNEKTFKNAIINFINNLK